MLSTVVGGAGVGGGVKGGVRLTLSMLSTVVGGGREWGWGGLRGVGCEAHAVHVVDGGRGGGGGGG